MTDDRRQTRECQMNEKARKGYLLVNQVDQGFLQQTAVSGMLLGQPNIASDSKGAWQLVARVHARRVKEGGGRRSGSA
eukprot:12068206-Alexandrium_andersonii.AAC.1